jgi:hypothetical protein
VSEAAVLERALRELARDVEFPPEPDLAETVARRLRTEPSPRRASLLVRRPLAVALAVLAVAVAAAFAVPQTRAAILDFLDIGGATVERVETLPPAEERGLSVPGRPVSLAEAERAASFPVRELEEYDTVYLDTAFRGGMVSFVSRDEGVVLTQFRGQSTPFVEKSAGPGTRIRQVEVDGELGYWLAGRRHVVVFGDEADMIRERRVAGNVLLWESGPVTYRLEGAQTLDKALELADALE